MGRELSVRIPREPQEVHPRHQDGLWWSQEEQGPQRPHHLPQGGDQISAIVAFGHLPLSSLSFRHDASLIRSPKESCEEKSLVSDFVPSDRHDRRMTRVVVCAWDACTSCNIYLVYYLDGAPFDLQCGVGVGVGLISRLSRHVEIPTNSPPPEFMVPL